MLSYLLFFLTLASLLTAVFEGCPAVLTPALLEGAGAAVTLCLGLAGSVSLWSGISEVLCRAGITGLLARPVFPLLSFLLRPGSCGEALRAALAENFTSNLLGIGNAATPAGLRAMALLEEAGDEKAAARLTLLNTSSVQLIPLTAAALRASHGAANPMSILPGVLFSSFLSLTAAFSAFSLLSRRG